MSNQTLENTGTLYIWDAVSKTDPSFTRRVTQRGGFTAIDATYQLKVATQVWGPYGREWGLRNLQYNFDLLDKIKMVILNAEFFYPMGAFEISNAITPTMGKGDTPDTDFLKKIETNTLSKALSKLGFSADVFMGQFDDAEYVTLRAQEAKAENSINQVDEKIKLEQQYSKDMSNLIELIKAAASLSELKGLFTKAVRMAKLREDEPALLKIERAKEKRKAELEAQEMEAQA